MKKIAIITIYDKNNYGNRLQNYAVQEILKKRGFNVETLRNINIVNDINYLEYGLSSSIKRRKCFDDFDKNINLSKDIIYHHNVPKDLDKMYDYFIIGSDQIWNYDFKDRFTSFVFAPFTDKNKRISLSASFGTDYIPKENIEQYKELNNLKAISVREDAGKEIVRQITNREDVEVLIDPTMMLKPEEWYKVMKIPENYIPKKYILKYFLGNVSKEQKKEIERIADKYNCDIVDVMDKNSFYNIGPSEILYLLKNTFFVITDSFHSCVFSVLFNKPFVVFERKNSSINMHSRINTFLSKFNLDNRIVENKIDDYLLKVDYTDAYVILEKEKQRYEKFIDKAFENG